MRILLIGVGNLGKRYLEGLIKIKNKNTKIFIYDKNKDILKDINNYYKNKSKNLYILKSLNKTPLKIFDLCILSTTANDRHILIKKIINKFKIKLWILEKLVSNRVHNLDKIYNLLKKADVYVNLPRNYHHIYQFLKKKKLKKIFIKTKGGNWNIGSNSIHHLYLLEWLTDDNIIKIDIYKDKFYPSKRNGYFDFYGKIVGYTASNSKISIESENNDQKFTTKINNLKTQWIINEHKGILKNEGKIILKNKFNLQSRITPNIIKSINKGCLLPKFKDIYNLHRLILLEYKKLGFFKVT